jgi:ABC-type branched-subunit amino acid transport system substrate-binding protein
VLLPLTGEGAEHYDLPLTWARDTVNRAGGVSGKKLELVYADLGKTDLASATRRFAADSSIVAVVGPDTSERAFAAASALTQAGKVVVTPSATSADLFRAFSSNGLFWRTVEPDIAQVRTMLTLAARGGANKVALLASSDLYGTTFYDWFGFIATELGLAPTAVVRYDQKKDSCDAHVDEALAGGADALLAVPTSVDTTACIARRVRASGKPVRLLFSDAAVDPLLPQRIGPQAEGLEGTTLVSDPASGFDDAFAARFHRPPTPYAANVYDAVTLIAYGLQRSGGKGGGRGLARAMADVVDGTGTPTRSDEAGVARALRAIGAGSLPDVSGATGPLKYDKESHTDLVSSTYGHWRIANGQFQVIEKLSTAQSPTAVDGVSAFRAQASEARRGRIAAGSETVPGPKRGLWALLVAASSGWDNYRHQADVLAQYQLLRRNGVPDDHIVVVSADDVALDHRNPHRGTVRDQVGGPNLRAGAHVDYHLADVDANGVLAILAGDQSPALPSVLHSGPDDDVYVFVAGHGDEQGIYFGLNGPIPRSDAHYSVLTRDALQRAVAAMAAGHRYRRMLIAIEACKGGTLGVGLDAPGAVLLSGASPVEDSESANYDPDGQVWLADQFSFELSKAAAESPSLSLDQLQQRLYLRVNGSHVSAYGNASGNPLQVAVAEFVRP